MTENNHQTLAGIKLLHGIGPEEISAIESRCGWRTYAPQEQIIDRQSDSKDVYFVTHGLVRVVNYSVSGREIAFDDIEAGNVFGELAALDGEPRSANVVAIQSTTVATLSPTAFQEVLSENPGVSLALMKWLAGVIRNSTERIMDLSSLGAHNRVYAEILRLAKANANEDNTALITPVPIHSDVASRVSTTRETVARVFSELSKKGLLKKEGNSIHILDLDRLMEMVEEFRGD